MTDTIWNELIAGDAPEPEAGGSPEISPTPTAVVIDGRQIEDAGRRDKITKAMQKRRSVPVAGYTGTSGHGKSASMIRDSLPSLALGRTIVSTVEILDAHTGNPHPQYVPFTSWHQFEDLRNTDILMDEITSIMDAQESTSLPKIARRLIPQQRRRNNVVRWSGIDWDNVNRRLRQMTQAVTMCRGFMPDYAATKADRDSATIPLWAPNRAFFLVTRDAQRVQASEDSKRLSGDVGVGPARAGSRRQPRALTREIWWGPGSLVFDSYRTLGEVMAVDGSCPICGGKPVEKQCRGHDGESATARPARRAH
jgi:hypothetical protein